MLETANVYELVDSKDVFKTLSELYLDATNYLEKLKRVTKRLNKIRSKHYVNVYSRKFKYTK